MSRGIGIKSGYDHHVGAGSQGPPASACMLLTDGHLPALSLICPRICYVCVFACVYVCPLCYVCVFACVYVCPLCYV